ncbi:GNAT family N-acetyltransferase [Nostocoides australiense]|nr:GNAT family N-acetyltransferase [Tetrasphaera australiensis]
MPLPPVPAGLIARPLEASDLDATYAVYVADEFVNTGQRMVEWEDIESDWQRPSFDLSTDSVGIFYGDRLVGAAEVFAGRRADGAVAPDWHGRGIGTWLLAWTEHRAKEQGSSLVGQSKFGGSPAEALLRGRGYHEMWTSWVLEVPEDQTITPQPLPDGYALREFTAADEHAAYHLIEDAFNEWPDRDPATFEDWRPRIIGRAGFSPWQIRFVTDPGGKPVGVAAIILDSQQCGYVDQLAVRKDHRGKGLARALLVDAFEEARRRGATRSELSTDSRTGALGLYEKVGMVVTQTWRHWAREL